MPPSAEPWIAIAAVASSMAMVISFVRVWRRRIERADRLREVERSRPVVDPFKVAMSHQGHRRMGAVALSVPPLDAFGEVVWSAAFGGEREAWLYLENAESPRLVAVVRSFGEPLHEDVESLWQGFGVVPALEEVGGQVYLAVDADKTTNPFDQLCLASAAVAIVTAPSTVEKALALTCSWFADGVEFGALPPFARIERDQTAGHLVLVAHNLLRYRQDATARVEFVTHSLPLSADLLRSARSEMPEDLLAATPFVRVIGGDSRQLHELAESM